MSICGQCEMESRTGTGTHGDNERCYCECHTGRQATIEEVRNATVAEPAGPGATCEPGPALADCFPCQGLGYFMQFDPGDGHRIADRTCGACGGTGRRQERQIPQPGYFTQMDGWNPREG